MKRLFDIIVSMLSLMVLGAPAGDHRESRGVACLPIR